MRAEENAKRTSVLDEFKRLDARPALDRSVLDLGERGIFYNRTAPAAPRVFAPPFLRSTETAEAASATDSALEDDEASARPRHFLMLSATVYEGGITELRWSREGRDFHVFSPINFLLFSGTGEFATAQADYDYFMAVSAESLVADAATATATRDLLAARVPADAVLLQRPAGYYVVQAPSSQPEPLAAAVPDSTMFPFGIEAAYTTDDAFVFMDAFHEYYRVHEAELRTAYQRRQTLQTAREAYLRDNPPPPRDTVINFAPVAPVVRR